MKRGYTALEYKAKIRKLRKVRPDICLTTDIIVGFPGETDADFEQTMDLVHDMQFDQSYTFIYSPRPGTPAAQLPDDVPMEVKKQRLAVLQARIMQHVRRNSANMLGSTQRVLVTGFSEKHPEYLTGRADNNRIVDFLGDKDLIGQMIPVEITEAKTNSLKGKKI